MSVKPGWYPDPAAPDTQRYWDGEQWVGAAIPADEPAPATPPSPEPPPPAVVPTLAEPPLPEPALPEPPPPAAPPSALPPRPALPTDLRLAPLGTRLAARVVDIVAVLLLNVVVNGYFFYQYYREVEPVLTAYTRAVFNGGPRPELAFSGDATKLNLIMSLVSIGLWFAYEVPATANSGQTLGKRLFGIKVTRLDAQQFTFGQSLRRWFVLGFPTLLGACGWPLTILDCLWCTWDRPAQQCIHDKVVQTVVVLARTPAVREPALTDKESR